VAQWETTSGTSNRWKRLKRRQSDVPVYARIAVPLLLVLLFGRLAWDGGRAILYQARHSRAEQASAVEKSAPQLVATLSPWQTDVADSLAASEREAGAGRLMTAEVDVDRADSIISVAQLQGRSAEPDFFAASIATLDRVEQRAKDDGMVPHVTQARIELAGLRSSLEAPADADDDENQVQIAAPRPIAAGTTLDPASLGGNYIDATLMADDAEILLPPSSRSLTDNVRVENLTLAGAAQTLDGIRWKNVTFVNTRLRYGGGPIDLQNVHFVRCSFGLTTDDRGAKIANAVALGQTTLMIQ
jgi:hypothetical protein